MYSIEFYETSSGYSEILEFLASLQSQLTTSKDARIQYQQIVRYIQFLQDNGTTLPSTIIKHLEGDIWELRPGNNRIFFFCFLGDTYILLHHFRKKTQKTPKREITQAVAEMNDYIQRKESQYELE